MVTVLGMWEPDWMDSARTERRLWKQTIQAFAVDRWAMCGVVEGPFTSPIQYCDLDEMLGAHKGRKTFLIPPGSAAACRKDKTYALRHYDHPEDAIYVFGNSSTSLVSQVSDENDVVSIYTHTKAAMFGHVVLAAVLYDRLRDLG